MSCVLKISIQESVWPFKAITTIHLFIKSFQLPIHTVRPKGLFHLAAHPNVLSIHLFFASFSCPFPKANWRLLILEVKYNLSYLHFWTVNINKNTHRHTSASVGLSLIQVQRELTCLDLNNAIIYLPPNWLHAATHPPSKTDASYLQ